MWRMNEQIANVTTIENTNTDWHEIDSIVIYGSNDEIRWEFIGVQPLSETVEFPNSKPFKYYRFEINRNGDKE